MKQELKKHLTPLIIIFIIISIIWAANQVIYYRFIYLFFGLLWGSFFLDLDHFIYWLYLNPKLTESRQARQFIIQKDGPSLLRLLEKTHKSHTSLIFHHYFFQIVLVLISLFIVTSSASLFTSAFVLALNIHLLIDQITDYRLNPRHLQKWLFARESKQLPIKYLSRYLGLFSFICLYFLIIIIKSPL